MLEDAAGIRRVILCCGYCDLRKGILEGTLFLFCGKRADRCKGLLWMGNGFLLLYCRFENGRLEWPRSKQEAAELTEEQFHLLMHGFDPVKIRIQDVNPQKLV